MFPLKDHSPHHENREYRTNTSLKISIQSIISTIPHPNSNPTIRYHQNHQEDGLSTGLIESINLRAQLNTRKDTNQNLYPQIIHLK